MNKKVLGFLLVGGGLVIAGITMFGYNSVNEKSDWELIQETQAKMAADAVTARAALMPVPESCVGVTLASFDRVCENEVYEGETPIPWATGLTEQGAKCVGDTVNAKRAYNALQRGREFDGKTEVADWVAILNACDVTGDLMLSIDGFEPTADTDAVEALNAWVKYLKE